MRNPAAALVYFNVMMIIGPVAARPQPGPYPAGQAQIVGTLEEAVRRQDGPAVLVFFSLDCHVCWDELFEVRYLVEKLSGPIAFVGISADSQEALEPFLAKHGFFYPVVCDQGRALFRKFKVRLEPLTVVIDGGQTIHRDNQAEAPAVRRARTRQCLLEISSKRPS